MDLGSSTTSQPGSSGLGAGRAHNQTTDASSAQTPRLPASLPPYQPTPIDFCHSSTAPPKLTATEMPAVTDCMGSSFSSLFPSKPVEVPGSGDAGVPAAKDSLFVDQHDPVVASWIMEHAVPDAPAADNFLFTTPSSDGRDGLLPSYIAEGSAGSEPIGFLSLQSFLKTDEQLNNTPSATAQNTEATEKEDTPAKSKLKSKPKPKPKAPPKSRAAPKTQKNAISKAAKPRQPAKNTKTAREALAAGEATKPTRQRKQKVQTETDIESRLLVPPSTSKFDNPALKWGSLENIINSGSAQDIAQAVRASRLLLDNLAKAIEGGMVGENGAGASMGHEWADRVHKLANTVDATISTSRRVLVGVVGRTGTGKSSIINSVLDEGRVVPTNGLRACTAVVTEIAWNPSDNPEERYMAQIHFVQPELWQKDVYRLYEDLKDKLEGDGGGYADGGDYAHSKIAFDKLRSVFPHQIKGKQSILSGECSVETLLHDAKVNRLLGSMQTVRAADADSFYSQIKEYLDTNVISSEDEEHVSTADVGREEEKMQLWPLIDVVRIYVKADILSTGVVLVDLPGFGDNNLARDAIAEGYLSQCSALWVVSPITRAVDDKEARALLDRSFKRQLSLDGTVNNLTFVCSKTDDVDISEITESLSEAARTVKNIFDSIMLVKHEIKAASDNITYMDQVEEPEIILQLREAEKKLSAIAEKAKRGADEAFRGEDDTTVNKRVNMGSIETAKESGAIIPPEELFQTNRTDQTGVEEATLSATNTVNGTTASYGESPQQLTEYRDELSQKLAILRECKASTKADYLAKVAEKEALEKKSKLVCVQMRNEYSRKRIKQDFAQGQKELDEELLSSAPSKRKGGRAKGKRGGKKSEPMRDYAELAMKLPVFCVSSRAYQAIRARDSGHPSSTSPTSPAPISCMQHADDTEIPQLQQHVKRIRAEHEMERGRTVLQGLLQLLTSLSAWAGCDGEGGGAVNFFGSGVEVHLTPEQEEQLNRSFLQLRENLSVATEKCLGSLIDVMDTKVLAKMCQLVQKSQEEAPKTVAIWARSRPKGGLQWQSYRAICRNKGYKTASKTSRSFTEELIGILLDGLVPTWTSTFNTKIPAALASYSTQMDKAVDRFHREMKQHCEKKTHQVLLQSVRSVQQHLRRAVHTAGADIEIFRKTVIQEPRKCACAVMTPIYDSCAKEAGKGCLGRMRASMAEHVDQQKDTMYAQMETRARNELAFLISDVIPSSLPSRLGKTKQNQPVCPQDEDTVHPDIVLGMFFDECRCLMGKADGAVTDTMQPVQDDIREVLETVADVFPEV